MIKFLLVLAACLLLILGVSFAFYSYVGINHLPSGDGQDWGQFGDYFGGVAGTLLSFVSILLLVFTVHLQGKQLAVSQSESLKRDQVSHVAKAEEGIDHWLQRELAVYQSPGETVEFGDVVWGLTAHTRLNAEEFKVATVRLHVLTCYYCEAIGLYKDNVDPYFVIKYHSQKASLLVAFLERHRALLDPMAGASLQFSRMHLEGAREA